MADYTLELRRVAEIYGENEVKSWFSDYNLDDFLTNDQKIDIISRGVWSKEKLAQKIYEHYYMREIGFETPAMFKHFAKVKMQEIMEAKLPIIWSNTIEYDPMVNVDYEESYTRNIEGINTNNQIGTGQEAVSEDRTTTANGEADSTGTSNGSSLSVNSDTPQGQISKAQILQGRYASSTTATEQDATTTSNTETQDTQVVDDDITRNTSNTLSSTGTDNKEETFTRRMKGNSGVMTTYQKLIQQYRSIIVAVDRDIIDELDSLFIGLF